MKISIKILTIVLLLVLSNILFAQNTDSSEIKLKINQLPALHTLIDSAKIYSPILKSQDTEIIIRELKKKSLKRAWSKYISVGTAVQYGTFDSYTSNINSETTTNVGSVSTGNQSRYSVGVSINLPIYAIYNRKNQINISQFELEQAKFEKNKITNELEQIVITLYADLLLAKKILVLKSENLNSINLQVDIGKKRFKNGQIKLSELVTIQGIKTKAQIDLEKQKSIYFLALAMLENTCGISLNK